ncbi:MAG: hypothetical protein KDC66_12240, partial [Phaeodactylibacter sp.]|nr:hypothetical protein [Phaeodactylibacter sp.]
MAQSVYQHHFLHRLFLTFALAGLIGPAVGWGQCPVPCPTIQAIMVNPCGSSQANDEYVLINSGGGFNIGLIQFDFDDNNNNFGPQNNDINYNMDNDPLNPTPCGLQPGDPSVIGGCSNVIPVGPGDFVPANSLIVLQTSSNPTTVHDFSSICGSGQCIYVVSNACERTAGAFSNTSGFDLVGYQLLISGCPLCTSGVVYDKAAANTAGAGSYVNGIGVVMSNPSCAAPPATASPPPTPNLTPLGPFCQTEAYAVLYAAQAP